MKKLFLILFMVFGFSSYAFETWGEYEAFCYINGIEPSYEEFEYYTNNGQCYYVCGADEELERLMSL